MYHYNEYDNSGVIKMYNMNKPYPKVGDIILYTVNKGDNVFRIAQMFDTTTELIKCMNNLKDDLENKDLEIRYLKISNLVKKILSPFSYAYLILKSNPKEISLNLKLYKSLKNSDEFDIGYYLANNEDIRKSKWIKYFSPQLHYVCRGFDEKREINKRYFKAESKKELLDHIRPLHSHKN